MAILRASAALHARIPLGDMRFPVLDYKDPMRANFGAHPTADAFFKVNLKRDDIF
jgi:hypothetical protein